MAKPKSIPTLKHFFTKVAGVTRTNSDGTSRQSVIRGCRQWERLLLDHEEDNPVDKNAVKVCRANGAQLGYLSAELCAEVVRNAKAGYSYGVYVSNLTGGTREKPTRGVNLLILAAPPGVSSKQSQQFLDEIVAGRDPAANAEQLPRTNEQRTPPKDRPKQGTPPKDRPKRTKERIVTAELAEDVPWAELADDIDWVEPNS